LKWGVKTSKEVPMGGGSYGKLKCKKTSQHEEKIVVPMA